MKNILFFIPRLYLGGAETQFRNIISGLDQKKYNISLFLLVKDINDQYFCKNNFILNLKYFGIDKNDLFRKSKLRNLLFCLNYIISSIQLVIYFLIKRFDVVISYATVLTPFIPILKLFNKKVIHSERTATKKLYQRKYLKFLLKMPDVITCNSPSTEKILNDLNIKNTIVILNGIEILKDLSHQEKTNVNTADINIYTIARISPDKNQMVILKALKYLKNKNIYFVGRIVDEVYYNFLLKYIKSNKLDNRVFFIPYTYNIKSIYEAADLIVLPSYEEGLSNVILESFLYKKYCITSNIDANKFLIENRGGMFNPNDSNELVNQINIFENLSIKEKEKIFTDNYYYIKNNFSLEKLVSEYEELICG